jgi:alpha-N-arabinofuranosidase
MSLFKSIISSLLLTSTSLWTAPLLTHIDIDVTSPQGEVNRHLFGHLIVGADSFRVYQNSGHELFATRHGHGIWNPRTRSPDERILTILKGYRPGMLRYPDGLGVHHFDWKETIGPLNERPIFQFGLDEFLYICERVGADPIIVVSEYRATLQDLADLVEYLNMPATPEFPWAMKRAENGREEPWGVRYFEMGNESWIDHRVGVPNEVRSGPDVGRHATAMAAAMKAVDPTIRTSVPYHTSEDFWNEAVLSHIGNDIDAIAVHIYPVRYGGPMLEGQIKEDFLQAVLLAGNQGFHKIQTVYQDAKAKAGRSLPIWLTEYNAGLVQRQTPQSYRFSLAAALMSLDMIGRSLHPEHKVENAIYWQWLNGFFGTVRTVEFPENERLTTDPWLRAAHHLFHLWGQNFSEILLPATVSGPRVTTNGFGSILPMVDEFARPARRLAEINLLDFGSLEDVRLDGVRGRVTGTNDYFFEIDGMTGQETYPTFGRISLRHVPEELRPPVPGLSYRVSFESRWIAEPGSSPVFLGLQIGDIRGWNASGSAQYIASIQDATDWESFNFVYQPRSDTEAVSFLGRLKGGSTPAKGRLEIRNLTVTPEVSATLPAPHAVSAYASLDRDHRWVEVILLNLSNSEEMPVHLRLNGASATGEVTLNAVGGESAAAVGDPFGGILNFTDVRIPVQSDGTVKLTLPPHSMTAARILLQ